MTDGIIKGTGDSRYLKGAGWPSTYAEFKAMAEAGTLPFDLNGINAAGWQQIGDALNKANLLSDTTAAKYFASVTGTETVDQVLSLLGNKDRFTQILTGTYGGTGAYGSASKNILIFPFVPEIVFVFRSNGGSILANEAMGGIWMRPRGAIMHMLSSDPLLKLDLTDTEFSGKTLSWYNSKSADLQLNVGTVKLYEYVAIG